MKNILRLITFLMLAFVLAGALAHLFELPNKMALTRDQYFTVQQIYRGWALLGIPLIGSVISLFILAIALRDQKKVFAFTLISLNGVLVSLSVFFVFTYPTNQATENWTHIPPNWTALRDQWEYSHAVAAILDLIAYISFVISTIWKSSDKENRVDFDRSGTS